MVETLYERLKMLEDKRKRRGIRYPLAALLVMIIFAKLSGVDDVRAMAEWIRYRAASLKPFLALKHDKTPHATTISRVMNSAIGLRVSDWGIIPTGQRSRCLVGIMFQSPTFKPHSYNSVTCRWYCAIPCRKDGAELCRSSLPTTSADGPRQ